jgi:DNA-binding CsgD family transcriptional regulator
MGWSGSEERMSALFESVLDCQSFDVLSDVMLQPIAAELGSNGCAFIQFHESGLDAWSASRQAYIGKYPQSLDAYVEGEYRRDIVVTPAFNSVREYGAVRGQISLMSAVPGWRKSDFYRQFLKPFDIGHILGFTLPVPSLLGNDLVCIGFHRSHNAPAYDRHDLGRLKRLAPLMRSVLCNLVWSDAISLADTINATLGNDGVGLVLLDDDLMIQRTNSQALLQLGSDDKTSAALGRPHQLLGDLREYLLNLPPSAEGLIALDLPCIPASQFVRVQIIQSAMGPRSYLLMISDRDGHSENSNKLGRFGLSPREIEIAHLICLGQSNLDISNTLGIALRTVENHLRSVYAKAQVNSRTRLMSKLASFH